MRYDDMHFKFKLMQNPHQATASHTQKKQIPIILIIDLSPNVIT